MNNDKQIKIFGNCLFLDIQTPLSIESSYFLKNRIDVVSGISQNGSPCVNAINVFSRIKISFSIFRSNQAFHMGNCLKITGLSFYLSHSWLGEMSSTSDEPDLGNTGALSVYSNQAYLWNVTFIGNRAFKASAILILNLNGLKQELYFDDVTKLNFF